MEACTDLLLALFLTPFWLRGWMELGNLGDCGGLWGIMGGKTRIDEIEVSGREEWVYECV